MLSIWHPHYITLCNKDTNCNMFIKEFNKSFQKWKTNSILPRSYMKIFEEILAFCCYILLSVMSVSSRPLRRRSMNTNRRSWRKCATPSSLNSIRVLAVCLGACLAVCQVDSQEVQVQVEALPQVQPLKKLTSVTNIPHWNRNFCFPFSVAICHCKINYFHQH